MVDYIMSTIIDLARKKKLRHYRGLLIPSSRSIRTDLAAGFRSFRR